MNAPHRGWRYAALLALILGLPAAVACSDEDTGTGVDDATGDDLEVEFPKIYSAFIAGGEHEFKVPARVEGASKSKIQWSAEPKDMVELEKQADGSVMITTKKAGEVKIIAKLGSARGTAQMTIVEATEDDWQNGKDRYANGIVPVKKERPDGGWGANRPDGGGKGERPPVNKDLACTNCHNKGGKDGADVQHTPYQTGGFSDEELVKIFTEATKPEGVDLRVLTKEKFKFHKWNMQEDEKKGIIVYLRSLEPKSQGEIDFRFPGRGKGKGGGKGGGEGKGKGDGEEKKETGDGGGAVN